MKKVAFVGWQPVEAQEFRRLLTDSYDIVHAPDLRGLRRLLTDPDVVAYVVPARTRPEDLVWADPDARAALDALDEAILVVDPDLAVMRANAKARELYEADIAAGPRPPCNSTSGSEDAACLRDIVRQVFETRRRVDSQRRDAGGLDLQEITVPVLDAAGEVLAAIHIGRDMSELVALPRKIQSIYSAGRALAAVDAEKVAHLSGEERLELIKNRILCSTRDAFGFDYFAILEVQSDAGTLRLVASEGMETVSFDELDLHVAAEGGGITGHVAHTGQPYLCNDVSSDPLYISPGGDRQKMSLLAVPLKLNDRVIGVFNVESEEPNAFDENDMTLLTIFADYVALSLNTAELLDREHMATRGQLAETLTRDISGPASAISTDVEQLIREYIGHDTNTTNRLNRVLANIDRINSIIAGAGDAEETQGVRRQALDPELAGRRILVADDDPGIRQSMSAILSGEGCTVDVACDGEEALNMVKAAPYALVLCDIRMPKKNGYELFSQMKTLLPQLPVILMTAFGYDPGHSIVKARTEGLETVLFKPFKVDKLKREIKKAIRAVNSGG